MEDTGIQQKSQAQESHGRVIRLFIPGIPRPGGSKRGFVNPRNGRVIITEDCKRSKDWRTTCAQIASETFRTGPLDMALSVTFEFCLPRPKGHYGKHGVRPGAPRHPAVKPDCTKLVRSTEDALSKIAWRDDALIVQQVASKHYAEQPGCWITISEAVLGEKCLTQND